MPQKSIRQALNEALRQEMRRDPRIIVIGEDVAGGAATEGQRDAYGGVLGVTKGLIGEFGEARVIDTPITESAIMGAAAGAAVTGLRPVAELMFSDFLGVCFDQIFNQAAKFRYMFGGKAKTPLVIRTMIGAGRSAAAQHSQSPYHIFTSVPGLKCELIDPRTTSPLDEDTILDSVERTGRLVIVDEATPRCSIATDIAALVADKAFAALKAPVKRVTAPHTPVPFAPSLEKLYIPSPERIAAAIREVHGYSG